MPNSYRIIATENGIDCQIIDNSTGNPVPNVTAFTVTAAVGELTMITITQLAEVELYITTFNDRSSQVCKTLGLTQRQL